MSEYCIDICSMSEYYGEICSLSVYYGYICRMGKARSIWYSGGGGAWAILEKNSLLWFWLKKIILLNGTVKKIIRLQ